MFLKEICRCILAQFRLEKYGWFVKSDSVLDTVWKEINVTENYIFKCWTTCFVLFYRKLNFQEGIRDEESREKSLKYGIFASDKSTISLVLTLESLSMAKRIINSILLSIKNVMYLLSPTTYDMEEGKSLGYLRNVKTFFFLTMFYIMEVKSLLMAVELWDCVPM